MSSGRTAIGEAEMAAKRAVRSKVVAVERPLRVLMIAPTSFFSDYGGHIRILEEAYILQGMGHEVAIVTYYKGSNMPGLDIRRTAPLPWRPEYEVGSSRHKIAFDVYLAWQSLVEARRFKPDVVISTGALPGVIAIAVGRAMGSRTIWVDSVANAEEMSMSGNLARRFAHLWMTQWEHVAAANGAEYAGSVL